MLENLSPATLSPRSPLTSPIFSKTCRECGQLGHLSVHCPIRRGRFDEGTARAAIEGEMDESQAVINAYYSRYVEGLEGGTHTVGSVRLQKSVQVLCFSPTNDEDVDSPRYVKLTEGQGLAKERPSDLKYEARCTRYHEKWLDVLASVPLPAPADIVFEEGWSVDERTRFLDEYSLATASLQYNEYNEAS